MKRMLKNRVMGVIYMLIAMLMVFVGCSREEGSEVGTPTEAVCFSAGSISRGVDLKESWSDGDMIAIFVADSEGVYSGSPYCYEITSTSGEMEAVGTKIYNDGKSTSFCAFYPYDSALASCAEYEARGAVDDASVDYLYCGTTTMLLGSVNLLFSHIYSMLSFNFCWGFEYDENDTFSSTLAIGSQEYLLDIEQMNASMFVVPTSDLGSVTLTTVVTSVEPNRVYVSELADVSEIGEWVMGEKYVYDNIAVGTADLLYNASNLEYEIYSAKGLKAFADLVNGESNTSGASVSLAVDEFGVSNSAINGRLMNNIDLSTICSSELGVDWTPIGKGVSYRYGGVFNGDNKFISKLYIDASVGDYQALFGYLHGATISNVDIVNSSVSGIYYYVGGLAGYASGASVIKCCRYEGSVSGGYSVGGLLGQANSVTIVSSYAEGSCSAFTNNVGGVVGEVASGGAALFGCYSACSVGSLSSGADMGGLVGMINSGSIIVLYDCYFWDGDDDSLLSVGEANGTLNTFQEGYSLEELNGEECVAALNSGVDYWCGIASVDNTINYIYEVGDTTPELILKR